jgi:pSer/pThr/pTyr-binding forkhead associated (FHA) protein
MQGPTTKDAWLEQWQLNDDVIGLRQWATDRNQLLPVAPIEDLLAPPEELVIGAGEASWLRLEDPQGRVSRRHATLSYGGGKWLLRDTGSTNGLVANGERCSEVTLESGMEIWLGGVTLIAESKRSIAVRAFLARLLGWGAGSMQAIDLALRSIRVAAKRCAPLVLCGEDELVLVARALHLRVLGAKRPFIVCDPRRKRTDPNVRSPENYQSGMEGLHAAKHGTLCIWNRPLPSDFADMKAALGNPDTRVQLVVCVTKPSDAEAFSAFVINVPALSGRASDLPRIVEEYADDITFELELPRNSFGRSDQEWVIEQASNSLPEIEKAILRTLVLRQENGNRTVAAAKLGMKPWSLNKWARRRNAPVPDEEDSEKGSRVK